MTSTDVPEPVRPLPSWVPAGWYPDPLGQGAARYWDGKRWSLNYRDSPPPTLVPTEPPKSGVDQKPLTTTAKPTTGSSNAAVKFWREIPMVFKIAIPIVLLIIIAAAAGGGGSKSSSSSASSSSGAEGQATAPVEAAPVALRMDTGDYSVTSSHTTLHGTVTANASVTVEGGQAHVRGTHWSKTVALEIGSNVVNVEATMAGHEPGSRTVTVTRHHTQGELAAKAQARRETEAREKEAKEREEHEEREKQEVENASVSRQNALKEAESYLRSSAFSEAGLIDQLSSEAGSQFPHADAVWAVEHLHVNWNEQAVKEARSYLRSSSFSCQGLTDQLSSEAGSQFTLAQAEYAVKQVGIC